MPDDLEPFEPDPDAPLDAPTYAESVWSGLINYTCLACGHSTLDYAQLTAHLHGLHRLTPIAAAVPASQGSEADEDALPLAEDAPSVPPADAGLSDEEEDADAP